VPKMKTHKATAKRLKVTGKRKLRQCKQSKVHYHLAFSTAYTELRVIFGCASTDGLIWALLMSGMT